MTLGLVGSLLVDIPGPQNWRAWGNATTNIVSSFPQKISSLARTSGEIVAINLIHTAHRGFICFKWMIYVFHHGFLFLDFLLNLSCYSLAIKKIDSLHIEQCIGFIFLLNIFHYLKGRGFLVYAFMHSCSMSFKWMFIFVFVSTCIPLVSDIEHWGVYFNHMFSYFGPCVAT